MAETHNHAPHDYYTPTGPSDNPDVSGYLSQDSHGDINTFMSEVESVIDLGNTPFHLANTMDASQQADTDELKARASSPIIADYIQDMAEWGFNNQDHTLLWDSMCLIIEADERGEFEEHIAMLNYYESEEGNAPVQDPMEFGEMANWTPLDGSEGLKRKRAEDDILNKYLSDDSPDQFTQQEYDRLISMNGYGDDNFDMAQAVLEIAGNRKRAEDDYDDYLFCEGCGEERKSVGPDSVFKIDNAREDVLDDGNVLCDRCHTRGYKIKRDAESFSAEYSGPSTLSSALSGARKTGRNGKHLTIIQRLVAKYGIDKGVKIYKHFGIKQKRASPKVRGKTRGTKSGPRRYSEGRVGGAGRSQVYQKGDRTGSWTPSGGHTTRFANSGKAWYQERGLGTPVAGPIPDTDLAGKAMGEKSRGSFVNPHGIVGYPFVPAQQRERKSKK